VAKRQRSQEAIECQAQQWSQCSRPP
jgi:hypothetical protein